ncbi:PREDICTED: uncharacterized protein LOC106821296 [Priapulus caudatus]|uniref:Uncharacterized protein LOC106821296 n=1 Tax=Priapulus caudatus TaxID=37621 RepID=A0ABM1FAR5_PRICU|nr:PREDICTED: uncharacterized protein LOC106821296 [Priapulus caudatus]
MFDASEGMLSYARTKVADYVVAGRVPHCEQLVLPCPIPGGEQHYDAICVNFVLHHLGSPDDNIDTLTFPKATGALRNIYDALRKGGLFLMITCLRQQLTHCLWHFGLIEKVDDLFKEPILQLMCGDYNSIEKILMEVGFPAMQATVPLHEIIMKPQHYYNVDTASDPKFILAVSAFALLKKRDKEMGTNYMETYFQRLHDLKESNKLEALIDEKEGMRKTYGCLTVIAVQKPSKYT